MSSKGPLISHRQAAALAKFLHEVRDDWDVDGIHSQLGYARERADVFDLAVAAIRAAQNHRNRTPAVIPLDGEHWRRPHPETVPVPRPLPPDQFCAICGRVEVQCRQAAQLGNDFHPYTPNVRQDGQLVDVATGEIRTRQVDPTSIRAEIDRIRAAATTHTEGAQPA